MLQTPVRLPVMQWALPEIQQASAWLASKKP